MKNLAWVLLFVVCHLGLAQHRAGLIPVSLSPLSEDTASARIEFDSNTIQTVTLPIVYEDGAQWPDGHVTLRVVRPVALLTAQGRTQVVVQVDGAPYLDYRPADNDDEANDADEAEGAEDAEDDDGLEEFAEGEDIIFVLPSNAVDG